MNLQMRFFDHWKGMDVSYYLHDVLSADSDSHGAPQYHEQVVKLWTVLPDWPLLFCRFICCLYLQCSLYPTKSTSQNEKKSTARCVYSYTKLKFENEFFTFRKSNLSDNQKLQRLRSKMFKSVSRARCLQIDAYNTVQMWFDTVTSFWWQRCTNDVLYYSGAYKPCVALLIITDLDHRDGYLEFLNDWKLLTNVLV